VLQREHKVQEHLSENDQNGELQHPNIKS
jgi:hypothetical protein